MDRLQSTIYWTWIQSLSHWSEGEYYWTDHYILSEKKLWPQYQNKPTILYCVPHFTNWKETNAGVTLATLANSVGQFFHELPVGPLCADYIFQCINSSLVALGWEAAKKRIWWIGFVRSLSPSSPIFCDKDVEYMNIHQKDHWETHSIMSRGWPRIAFAQATAQSPIWSSSYPPSRQKSSLPSARPSIPFKKQF